MCPMAVPAEKRQRVDAPPRVDPVAVPRAISAHRARRYAREDHEVETKRARIRFWGLILGLLFLGAILTITIWDLVQSLFGIGP